MAKKAASEFPKIVHAYRRLPHMLPSPSGIGEVEKDVEVVCCGEKIKFRSNDAGHIVGTVTTPEAFKRLTHEIPEAYIEYAGGDNVPEKGSIEVPSGPQGEFVLKNDANGDVMVLDGQSDEDVRAFAADAGIEDEALPDALTGDTLKRAVVNLLKTA